MASSRRFVAFTTARRYLSTTCGVGTTTIFSMVRVCNRSFECQARLPQFCLDCVIKDLFGDALRDVFKEKGLDFLAIQTTFTVATDSRAAKCIASCPIKQSETSGDSQSLDPRQSCWQDSGTAEDRHSRQQGRHQKQVSGCNSPRDADRTHACASQINCETVTQWAMFISVMARNRETQEVLLKERPRQEEWRRARAERPTLLPLSPSPGSTQCSGAW